MNHPHQNPFHQNQKPYPTETSETQSNPRQNQFSPPENPKKKFNYRKSYREAKNREFQNHRHYNPKTREKRHFREYSSNSSHRDHLQSEDLPQKIENRKLSNNRYSSRNKKIYEQQHNQRYSKSPRGRFDRYDSRSNSTHSYDPYDNRAFDSGQNSERSKKFRGYSMDRNQYQRRWRDDDDSHFSDHHDHEQKFRKNYKKVGFKDHSDSDYGFSDSHKKYQHHQRKSNNRRKSRNQDPYYFRRSQEQFFEDDEKSVFDHQNKKIRKSNRVSRSPRKSKRRSEKKYSENQRNQHFGDYSEQEKIRNIRKQEKINSLKNSDNQRNISQNYFNNNNEKQNNLNPTQKGLSHPKNGLNFVFLKLLKLKLYFNLLTIYVF